MTATDIQLLIYAGLVGIPILIVGIQGIVNRKKINNVSHFYSSIGLSLLGSMTAIFLIALLFFRFTAIGRSMMSEKRFDVFGIFFFIIISFIWGTYGIVNRKKFSKPARQIDVAAVVGSIISTIGTIIALLRWGFPK